MKYDDFIKSRYQICINANKKTAFLNEKNIFSKALRKLCEFLKRVAGSHPKFHSPAEYHDKMTFYQILGIFFKIN